MKVIKTSELLQSRFRDLFRNHDKFACLSAWAGFGFYECKVLVNHQDKIDKMVIGTHMFHTSPDFIEAFINAPNARFWKPTGDLFHPKLYLFYSKNSEHLRWTALIGSANFSKRGFGKNKELLIEVNQSDSEYNIFEELKSTIDQYWREAPTWTPEYFEKYKEQHVINKSKVSSLRLEFDDDQTKDADKNIPSKDLLESEIFTMTWNNFIKAVGGEKEHRLEDRIFVLEKAKQIWDDSESGLFADLEIDDRKFIAGLPCSDNRAAYFGSMKGAGEFHKAVNNNNPLLSQALAAIPLSGGVVYGDYASFIESFSQLERHGLATATRLLAMKRPDVFVCLDSKNLDRLCEDFGIKKTVGYDDYWYKIVEPIKNSTWWNASIPEDNQEKSIYRGRAAFLDALYYVWEK